MAPFKKIVTTCLMGSLALSQLSFSARHGARGGAAELHPTRSKQSSASPALSFQKEIKPLLGKYCLECHNEDKKKGGLVLDRFPDDAAALADKKVWEKVLLNVQNGEMPPKKREIQPSGDERQQLVHWIEHEVFKCDCENPDPGKVTVRRLNKAEYNNTIRDLLHIDFRPADDFPSDDVGYGFDNIGDVLSMPPILLEKYMAAAEKALEEAIELPGGKVEEITRRFEAEEVSVIGTLGGGFRGGKSLVSRGEFFTKFQVPASGTYRFSVKAFANRVGEDLARMAVKINGQVFKEISVDALPETPGIYELEIPLRRGERTLSVAFLNEYRDTDPKVSFSAYRRLGVDYFEVQGPVKSETTPPRSYSEIFFKPVPEKPADQDKYAREILSRFARRAFRRPATTEEVERLMKIVALGRSEKETFERSVQLAMQAVLVSPHFLFRGEPVNPQPKKGKQLAEPISELELASRLSYFLWSSMPDEELLSLAEKNKLRKNLDRQVKRMIADRKSGALVENFAGQWLQLRNLNIAQPDRKQFPAFNESLRADMKKETELFFEHVMREDRSLLEFINANYSFLNHRLARHYGVPPVEGEEFQKVVFTSKDRGGILTQGSILTLTSNPTRTSPVKRGKWVLETILGTPPPPPPPEAGELNESKEAESSGSLRQRTEQHRAKPMCASCHDRMDPIGFGLENFNAIGAWREKDGEFAVDSSGELFGGKKFQGPGELKSILTSQSDAFAKALSEKMLTYALGRGLEYYDKCAVESITAELKKRQYRFSTLVLEIVESTPFQKRRR